MTYTELVKKLDNSLDALRRRQESGEDLDAEGLVDSLLERIQANTKLRSCFAVLAGLALLAAMAYFIWGLLPRSYNLSISGGDILSNRHQLAVALRDAGVKSGLHIAVQPISGTFAILEAVNERKVDVALIQGGLDVPLPNVRHVAMVMPETLHLLVRDNIKNLQDLRGKVINMGSAKGGTRVIGEQVLDFSELNLGVDYAPSTFSAEELLALPERRLPDAVLNISSVPSFVVEELVKLKGYHLLEIPFPKALAMRHGWVADSVLLPYTYKATPPVPAREITSLGVNLFMVCHKDVPPLAVLKLLDTLYSSAVGNSVRTEITPATITQPSGYPNADGTELFLKRNDPIFSEENLERLKALVGLLMSTLTFVLMAMRWLRGKGESRALVEEEFREYLELTARCQDFLAGDVSGQQPPESEQQEVLWRMARLRAGVMERLAQIKTVEPHLLSALLQGLNSTQSLRRV